MRFFIFTILLVLFSFSAQAEKISDSQDVEKCKEYRLCIHVSKVTQHMQVWMNYDGYAFPIGSSQSYEEGGLDGLRGARISTARPGHSTPTGTFKVEEVARGNRVSSLYEGAALYFAMQIDGNIFIHATAPSFYGRLGFAASAGCVRTTLNVAELLNTLMLEIGANVNDDREISEEELAVVGPHIGRGGVLNKRGRDNIRVVITDQF